MKLKELREKTSSNQTQIAIKIGIPRNSYNKYELEQVEPDIKTLCQIADFYNVSLDYLCEHKTNSIADIGPITAQQKMAINILVKLPEQYFYEYLGRLKTTADLLKIQY